MSYKITVRPSGHTFEAEPSETLLQAGLRAGLNLGHSCANGSCGDCRARLLAGEISPLNHYDYRFSELEKQQGWFLMCSCRALNNVEIEAHESGSATDIPEQHIHARVSRVERLQDEVVQLTVRAPRSGGLRFLAGQGVTLSFKGMRLKTLPIASCPCDSMQLRFHVRRRDDDPFSEFVFGDLRKGREVMLHGPSGNFTLDEESTRPLVFVAWESGFAPVSSLIDHAIQKDENRSIDLYWLSAIPRGHYLSNYCRAWRDVLDDFRYHSIDLDPVGDERLERVVERIVRVHTTLQDSDFYLALPEASLGAARACLQRVGVAEKRIHTTPLMHA
jgi:CDP-4-dehydro-6-deoxyglucose reductase